MRTFLSLYVIASLMCPMLLRAETVAHVAVTAATNGNTLNDLIRRIPILSFSRERELRKLSAIQERLYLHELRMRGEGLEPRVAAAFSINYSEILSALVEDRVTEDYGRELLYIHRQLIDRMHLWTGKKVRDERFPVEVIANLEHFRAELRENALLLTEVPPGLRTPVVNGYQVWVDELLAWGCECGFLTPGAISQIQAKADELERFEGYYKADGVLQEFEREQLHGRFLQLTRETIEVLAR